jgi:hypothetical protein
VLQRKLLNSRLKHGLLIQPVDSQPNLHTTWKGMALIVVQACGAGMILQARLGPP